MAPTISTTNPGSLRQLRLIVLVAFSTILVLVFGGFLTWRLRLVWKVKSRLAAIRAQGLPTNPAELSAAYPPIPDNQNAALVLTQAFSLLQRYPDKRSREVFNFCLRTPARKQALTAEEVELLSGHLEMNRTALAKAQEAFPLTSSRFPIDLSFGAATPLPHLTQIRDLNEAAQIQAILGAQTGRIDEICGSLKTMIGFAHSLDNEPVLISQLVRMGVLSSAVQTLQRVLNHVLLGDEHLVQLNQLFAEAEQTNRIAIALVTERALYIPYFRMSPEEAARLRKPAEEGQEQEFSPLPGNAPAILRMMGLGDRDLLFYLDVLATNLPLAALPPPRSMVVETNFDRAMSVARKHYFLLSAALFSSICRANSREARSLAETRTASIALAIERFHLSEGRFPATLSDLVPKWMPSIPADPFDGKELRYHLRPNGYVVYSIAQDGHDDGGAERPTGKIDLQATYDITFIVER